LFSSEKVTEEEVAKGLASAPLTIQNSDLLPDLDIQQMNLLFKPEMGQMNALALPENLPLDFIASEYARSYRI
jgi:hypothetical protein